jgi:L-amino acid N-acyltransferase YncA
MLTLRSATAADVPAVTEIYSDAILKTVASFYTQPKPVAGAIVVLTRNRAPATR